MSSASILEQLGLTGVEPEDTAIWTGAGVSRPGPSCLPLGDTLTRAVLAHACGQEATRLVLERLERAQLYDATGERKTLPRLEALLQQVIGVLGPDEALRPLQVLEGAAPNGLHRFFAAHVEAKGRHLTTNFDDCIERAAPRRAEVVHLHGRYDPEHLSELGVEVTRLSRGLATPVRDSIVSALSECTWLIVCGYSGRDYYDVDPFFRGLLGMTRFPDLKVVWLVHGDGPPHVWPGEPSARPPMLELLERLGASTATCTCNTATFLEALATEWGFAPVTAGDCLPLMPSLPAIPGRQQALAAAAVMSAMGMGQDLVDFNRGLIRNPSRQSRALRREAAHSVFSGYAHTGRYRRAIFVAATKPIGGRVGRAHRLQLVAAVLVQRGNLLLAGLAYVVALRAFAKSERGLDDASRPLYRDAQIEWLQYQRVLTTSAAGRGRLTRSALRWWAELSSRASGAPVEAAWTAVSGDADYIATHPHSVAQLDRLHDELEELQHLPVPPALDAKRDRRSNVYFEADSITGYTNAERDELRDQDSPGREDLQRLYERSRAIDDRPGILKAALLLRHHGHPVALPVKEALTVGYSYPWKLRFWWRWLRREPWHQN